MGYYSQSYEGGYYDYSYDFTGGGGGGIAPGTAGYWGAFYGYMYGYNDHPNPDHFSNQGGMPESYDTNDNASGFGGGFGDFSDGGGSSGGGGGFGDNLDSGFNDFSDFDSQFPPAGSGSGTEDDPFILEEFVVTSDNILPDFEMDSEPGFSDSELIDLGTFDTISGSGFDGNSSGGGFGGPAIPPSAGGSAPTGWQGLGLTEDKVRFWTNNKSTLTHEEKLLFFSQFPDQVRRNFIEYITRDLYSNQSWYEGSAQQEATQIRRHVFAPDLFEYPEGGYWSDGEYITRNLNLEIPTANNWGGNVLNNLGGSQEIEQPTTFPSQQDGSTESTEITSDSINSSLVSIDEDGTIIYNGGTLPDFVVTADNVDETVQLNDGTRIDERLIESFFDYELPNDAFISTLGSSFGSDSPITNAMISDQQIIYDGNAYSQFLVLARTASDAELIQFLKDHPNIAQFVQANDILYNSYGKDGVAEAFENGEIGNPVVNEIRNPISVEPDELELESTAGAGSEAIDLGQNPTVEFPTELDPSPELEPIAGTGSGTDDDPFILPEFVVTPEPEYPYPASGTDWQMGAEMPNYLLDPNGYYIMAYDGISPYLTVDYAFGKEGGIPLEDLTPEIIAQKNEENRQRNLALLRELGITADITRGFNSFTGEAFDLEQPLIPSEFTDNTDEEEEGITEISYPAEELPGIPSEGELTQEEQDEIQQGTTTTIDPETGETIFVLPDFVVTADNSDLLDGIDRSIWGDDITDEEILELLEDGYTPYRPELYFPSDPIELEPTVPNIDISGGLDIDLNEALDPTPDTSSLAPFDQARLDEISNRFSGTRRAYNDWRRTDEGQEAIRDLGDLINSYTSPSGQFDLTKADEVTDKTINILSAGGLNGLNAFAMGINIVEGITRTDLIDPPNVGFLVNNLYEQFIGNDSSLVAGIESVIPDFVERMTGLDALLSNSELASGYLYQGFDLSDYLLGDTNMLRQVDYGLLPATQQIAEQREDYLREFLGNDAYDAFIGENPDAIQDPNLLQRIGGFFDDTLGILDPAIDLAQTAGFLQQKYLGGALPQQLINALTSGATGLPVGTILDFVGAGLAPTGQELSDYLYSQGIDPTTANASDVARFVQDRDYSTPEFDPETGQFILYGTDQPIPDEDLYSDFGSATLQNLGNFFGGALGDLIAGRTSIGDIASDVVSGTVGELEETADGVADMIETGLGPIDDVITTIGGGPNEIDPATGVPVVFPTDQELINEHNQAVVETDADPNLGNDPINPYDPEIDPSIDPSGNINNTNIMPEEVTVGEEYDPAYETAKLLIGAERAERFRGLGLSNTELQDIIGAYQSDVSTRELDRLLALSAGEQEGINELRDVQRQSDLDLIGEYGGSFADAVRGLDPTALGVLGEQEALSQDLYRRARGELTEQEKTRNAERAFELSAQTGRSLDDTRIRDAMYADEDYKANLEQRAQQAGTSTYNMSRGLTGNIPALLLGNTGNPYGTGVGQVAPPLGVGDVISAGVNNFAQQQNVAKTQEQIASLQSQYQQAIADNDPSTAETILGYIQDATTYLNIAKSGLNLIGNLPGQVQDFKDSFSNARQGFSTLFRGGNTGVANYNFDGTSGLYTQDSNPFTYNFLGSNVNLLGNYD